MATQVALEVRKAAKEDIYRDFIRIPKEHRIDECGRPVPEGHICRMRIGERTVYGIARGHLETSDPVVMLDERLREMLAVEPGQRFEVKLQKSGRVGQFLWLWRATDPAYRLVAVLGVLSVVLGFFGLMLGVISMILSVAL